MSKRHFDIQTSGAMMRVVTRRRHKLIAFGATAVMAAFGIALAVVRLEGTERALLIAGSVAVLAGGAGLGFFRRSVALDRDRNTVTSLWSWLFLSGGRTMNASQGDFYILRTQSRSDSGTTDSYHVYFGDLHLLSNSEYQGDQKEAERVAKAMAKHVGAEFQGTRKSDALKRADARRAKFAMVPLLIVMVALVIGAFVAIFVIR